ncbi:MAG: L-lactate dehydrogenase, partial [Lactococcus lactis]|nr:L-lactate dehydrogenase [Lactococcus lactis]
KNKKIGVEDLSNLSNKVKNAAYEIIDKKQATYYGIGMSTARIVKAILNNEQAILPVSAYLRGEYGQEGVFTGVLSIVNQNGVREIIELNIDTYEKKQFEKSVSQLKEVIESIK